MVHLYNCMNSRRSMTDCDVIKLFRAKTKEGLIEALSLTSYSHIKV